MTPDDPRHGTYAGFQVHKGEREQPCDDCAHANYLYVKRMKARLAKGQRNLVPLGEEAHKLLVDFPVRLLAELSGIGDPKLYGYREGGPDTQVHVKTKAAILSIPRHQLYTVAGIRRRIQALARLGYSAAQIAAESGVNVKTIEGWRSNKPLPEWVRRPTAVAIVETYERLSMTLPEPSRSATRARMVAEHNGWPPPLAFDDIDVVTYNPGSDLYKKRIDEVVVQRVMAGDVPQRVTPDERREVARRWIAAGRGANELARLTGWKPERYYQDDVA